MGDIPESDYVFVKRDDLFNDITSAYTRICLYTYYQIHTYSNDSLNYYRLENMYAVKPRRANVVDY